jgi:tetratricopeptide (TPR) repeat protein
VELNPDSAEAHTNLGAALNAQGRVNEAIACWRRALELNPNCAGAHNNLGNTFKDQGMLTEAMDCFRRALAIDPNLASAQLGLGRVYEQLGDLAEAESAFREALRLQPENALPHTPLAMLLGGKLPDADLAALQKRLDDPQLPAEFRARLLFGQAYVLDARGDYARAADSLREANALALKQSQRQNRAYIPSDHERFVEHLARVFTADFFARTAGAGLDTRRPVFVFGLPRSGTTLVEQILASHSAVYGAGELPFARQALEAIPKALASALPPLECIPRLDAATIGVIAQQYEDQLRATAGTEAERIVDKMPENYLYLGLLAVMFQHAVFIH